jgi:hypothetical protein
MPTQLRIAAKMVQVSFSPHAPKLAGQTSDNGLGTVRKKHNDWRSLVVDSSSTER